MGKNCPTCGARTVTYRFRLNKGLISALVELYRAGGGGQGRPVQLGHLNITKAQYSNFPKLRYWAFASADTKGRWRITQFGAEFVEGRAFTRPMAHTHRGRVLDLTGETVTINDLFPGYDWREFYASTASSNP